MSKFVFFPICVFPYLDWVNFGKSVHLLCKSSYSIQIRENTNLKNLWFWTIFTQFTVKNYRAFISSLLGLLQYWANGIFYNRIELDLSKTVWVFENLLDLILAILIFKSYLKIEILPWYCISETQRKMCLYSGFFWSVLSRICTAFRCSLKQLFWKISHNSQ